MNMRTFLVLLVATFSASCLNRVKGIDLLKIPEGMAGKFNNADTELIKSAFKTFNEEAGKKSKVQWDESAINEKLTERLEKLENTDGLTKDKVNDHFEKLFADILNEHHFKLSWTKLQKRLTPEGVKGFTNHISMMKALGESINMDKEILDLKIEEAMDSLSKVGDEKRKLTDKEVQTYYEEYFAENMKSEWFKGQGKDVQGIASNFAKAASRKMSKFDIAMQILLVVAGITTAVLIGYAIYGMIE